MIARLLAYAGTAQLIGTRVWRVVAPQNTAAPNVVVSQTAQQRIHLSGADCRLVGATIQVDSWAANNAAALALAEVVEQALSRQWGTWDGVVVQHAFLEDSGNEFEPETRLWRERREFTVWYEEPSHV